MKLLEEIEVYAHANRVPIMEKAGITFLCDFINEQKIQTILEIGTAIGYSAICMAKVDPSIKIVSIERDNERYELAQKNVALAHLENQITLVNADALTYQSDQHFDMVFIDAAKGQYIKFFEGFNPNVNQGGYIVSDNLGFHGLVDDEKAVMSRRTRSLVKKIRAYIAFLKSNALYETIFKEIGDGIGISQKK